MTSAQPYQTLRIILFVVAAICAVGAIVLCFATSWVLTFGTTPPPSNGFEDALVKGFGVFVLALGYLLCVAARDPVRYVAVVDAFIFILLAGAVLNVYGVVALGLGAYYPAGYLVARAIAEIILAAVLFWLRPKAGGPLPAP